MSDSKPRPRWTLEHAGRRLEVETRSAGLSSLASLFVDGERVDEQKAKGEAKGERVELEGGGVSVRVRLTMLGGVRECIALLPAAAGERRKELAFAPPPGTRAAKREALARKRPKLYAARHVAIATGQILLAVLGISALFGFLLPRLPIPSIDLPRVDLPSLPLPQIDLPDIAVPGWLEAILGSSKFWLPILIAIGYAAWEVRKRAERQRNAEEQAEAAEAPAQARSSPRSAKESGSSTGSR